MSDIDRDTALAREERIKATVKEWIPIFYHEYALVSSPKDIVTKALKLSECLVDELDEAFRKRKEALELATSTPQNQGSQGK